jgi:acetamidase/formamidase
MGTAASPVAGAAPRQHLLRSTPGTVHWGFYDAELKPVLTARTFGRQNSKEPREFGGNLDCKELVAGSTPYFPVRNVGALFSTGDGHAAQGDGEVDGTAIETSLRGTFEFHVRKGLGWTMPRAETATHFIAFGLDLDDAARQALPEMLAWIVEMTGMPRGEAYALCSFACDLRVTQTVNNVKGVHAMMAKSVLRPRSSAGSRTPDTRG